MFPDVLHVPAVHGIKPPGAAVRAFDRGDLLARGVGGEWHDGLPLVPGKLSQNKQITVTTEPEPLYQLTGLCTPHSGL